MIKDVECSKFINKNYISKDKIKQKYEELEEYDYIPIEILLELLED